MKKIILFIKRFLVAVALFAIVWFLLFSIGAPIILYIDNGHTLYNTGIALFVYLIVSTLLSIAFTFITLWSITKTNKISVFVEKHVNSFVSFLALLAIFSIAIYNSRQINLDLCNSLLAIEWAIFGLSIAVFLYRVQNQENKMDYVSSLNPEKSFGKARLEQVTMINDMKDEFLETKITLAFIIINAVSLMLFSASLFLFDRNQHKDSISLLFTISLFFTTNTFLQVFLDVIRSYNRKKKLILQKDHIKKDYNIVDETLDCLIDEGILGQAIDIINHDETLTDDEKKVRIDNIIKIYIKNKKEAKKNNQSKESVASDAKKQSTNPDDN